MPPVARSLGVEQVNTVHNSAGKYCARVPSITATQAGSSDVRVNNIGVVRVGDASAVHRIPGCSSHATPLAVGSSTVRANNRPLGRLGDTYACGALIITGSGNVNAGG